MCALRLMDTVTTKTTTKNPKVQCEGERKKAARIVGMTMMMFKGVN